MSISTYYIWQNLQKYRKWGRDMRRSVCQFQNSVSDFVIMHKHMNRNLNQNQNRLDCHKFHIQVIFSCVFGADLNIENIYSQ